MSTNNIPNKLKISINYCVYYREVSGAESLRQSMTEQLAELRREVTALEHQLAIERAATEAEKRRTSLLQVSKQ